MLNLRVFHARLPSSLRTISRLARSPVLKFFDFARKGDVQSFRAPLAAGLPANLTNDKGDTLVGCDRLRRDVLGQYELILTWLRCSQLMLAAYNGHADVVSLLVSHGGDPNRLNDRQQVRTYPTIPITVQSDWFRRRELLLQLAPANTLPLPSQSPLAGAVFKNEPAVIDALLAAGADPLHGNPSGLQSAQIFNKQEWIQKFEDAPGKGKAAAAAAGAGPAVATAP